MHRLVHHFWQNIRCYLHDELLKVRGDVAGVADCVDAWQVHPCLAKTSIVHQCAWVHAV